MSLCDECPEPGHCCRAFPLNHDFSVETGPRDVQRWLDNNGWDQLRPIRRLGQGMTVGDTRWLFSCTWLTEEGRCGHHEDRPDFCRTYEPGTDGLCVLADANKFTSRYHRESQMRVAVESLTDDEAKLLKELLYGERLSEVS